MEAPCEPPDAGVEWAAAVEAARRAAAGDEAGGQAELADEAEDGGDKSLATRTSSLGSAAGDRLGFGGPAGSPAAGHPACPPWDSWRQMPRTQPAPPSPTARFLLDLVSPLAPPPDISADPSSLIRPAVLAYWTSFHPLFPVVHKAAFEAAFAAQSAIYKSGPPLALLFAIAALGSRTVGGLPEAERIAFAAWCCDVSRMLVLARAPADIEGAQAMCLMLHVLLIAGLPRKMYAVLQHCANTCDRLWFGLKPGFPTSANAWIYRELVLRLRILVGAFDVSTAFYSGGKMFAHYFYPSTFPLPAGEGFFDHPDPSSAFDAYRSLRRTGEPSMRFGTLDWDAVGRSVAVLAAAPFSGSSVLSLFHYASFARYVRMALSRPTPAFSVFAAQYAALVDSALTSLPPDVSLPLSRGDPLPLLRSPHFPTRAHAHAAVLSLLFADVHAVEAGLSADPSAEQRGEVIARCLRVASAAHALALDDPEGRIANHVLANPAYVVGRVLLAEVAAGRGGKEAVSGVEKVAWCLELYGRCFGLQPRRLAARFAQECLRAGLRQVPQRDPGPAPIGDDPGPAPIDDDPAPRGGEGEARFFAEVLLEGGEGKLGWLPAVRPVAS